MTSEVRKIPPTKIKFDKIQFVNNEFVDSIEGYAWT